MNGEYRVICDTHGVQEWNSLSEALNSLQRARDNTQCVNPRIQRMVWEDVPEPEPLPDLPTTLLWAVSGNGRGHSATSYCYDPSSQCRVFHGTVSEWVEVTE